MMRTTKTVEVEVPELDTLAVDPSSLPQLQQLDTLCQAARVVQSEIRSLESTKAKLMDDGEGGGIRNLASALNLPERVLGTGWDLRRSERTTESLDVAKLKLELLRLNIGFDVVCSCRTSQSAEAVDLMGALKASLGMVQTGTAAEASLGVCSLCGGSGIRPLEGLPAVNHLIESCTDRKTSVSWSVYGRDEKKKEDPT